MQKVADNLQSWMPFPSSVVGHHNTFEYCALSHSKVLHHHHFVLQTLADFESPQVALFSPATDSSEVQKQLTSAIPHRH